MTRLTVVISVLCALYSPALAEEPAEQLKTAMVRVMEALQDPISREPRRLEERLDQIRGVLKESFDWQEASRLILWRHWGRLTQDERDEFTALFSDVTVRGHRWGACCGPDEACVERQGRPDHVSVHRARKHVEGLRHRDRRRQRPLELAIADRPPDPALRLRRHDEAAEAEAEPTCHGAKPAEHEDRPGRPEPSEPMTVASSAEVAGIGWQVRGVRWQALTRGMAAGSTGVPSRRAGIPATSFFLVITTTARLPFPSGTPRRTTRSTSKLVKTSRRAQGLAAVVTTLLCIYEPEAVAGHFDWQRPHCMQASKSSRCFQVKSDSRPAPNDSAVSKSLIGACGASIGLSR